MPHSLLGVDFASLEITFSKRGSAKPLEGMVGLPTPEI
jgi:hypothetical protein